MPLWPIDIPPAATTGQACHGTPRGAVVRSDRPVVAQQLVRLEQGGLYALDGTAALSRTWYLAEANTRAGYETVITVLNPGPAAARLQVTYMPEGRPQVAKSYAVPAKEPLHVSVNADMPDAAMGIAVESDQPVAVSRVTYLDGGESAHATLGAPAAAGTWYLPDVNAAEPRITFVILLNPGTSPLR